MKKSRKIIIVALIIIIVSIISIIFWVSNSKADNKEYSNETRLSDTQYNNITTEKESNKIIEPILSTTAIHNNLVANENDFVELIKLLENIDSFDYHFEYSSSDSDAYRIILSKILGPLAEIPLYSYIYNKEAEYIYASNNTFKESPAEELDPLGKFNEFYAYGKVSADEIDWIIQNIFNVTPDRNHSTIMDGEICILYYHKNYYYFACGDGGDAGAYPVIKNKHIDESNTYTIEYDLIYDDSIRGTYEIVCKLKRINNQRQWTLLSIKKIDIE